jgi:hypothetical protein
MDAHYNNPVPRLRDAILFKIHFAYISALYAIYIFFAYIVNIGLTSIFAIICRPLMNNGKRAIGDACRNRTIGNPAGPAK